MNILKLVVSLLATALAGAAFPTMAQYPDKPVKIIARSEKWARARCACAHQAARLEQASAAHCA
jgi:hypothetical protein